MHEFIVKLSCEILPRVSLAVSCHYIGIVSETQGIKEEAIGGYVGRSESNCSREDSDENFEGIIVNDKNFLKDIHLIMFPTLTLNFYAN